SFETDIGLAPMPVSAPVTVPGIVHAVAAGESDPPVHHDDSAVVALVRPFKAPEPQGAEVGYDRAAGRPQGLVVPLRQPVHLGGVEYYAYVHARTASVDKGLDDFIRDLAFVKNVGFECDGDSSRPDGFQQCGKRLLAVQKNVYVVVANDRRSSECF